jgi:hypothetical protein
MLIRFNLSVIKRTKWYEYLLRFALGGAITLVAGLLAERFGPAFGGLFLAFPAIFPASATLIEKHEEKKKRRAGIVSTKRGRLAAALDGRGALLGGFGLLAFAFVAWQGLSHGHEAALTIAAATAVWLVVSLALWLLRRRPLIGSFR